MQYADDTTGVFRDEKPLGTLLELLKNFEKVSGLKINRSKSECMWIGESRDCKREIFGLKWLRRPIKCLGVYLTYDSDEFIKLNYKQRLKKMENTVSWWKGRGLTIYGRVQIINSLLLPTLISIASMFPISEQVIKEVNKVIYKFLWRGPDRVIRSAVINDYENGG